MTTGETEAFATRLPATEAARVRDGVEQTGLSRSDLLARALRYYVAENPDGIPAFHSVGSEMGHWNRAVSCPLCPRVTRQGSRSDSASTQNDPGHPRTARAAELTDPDEDVPWSPPVDCSVSSETVTIFERTLAPIPGDRYDATTEFVEAMRNVLG